MEYNLTNTVEQISSKEMLPRILIFQPLLPHYRVAIFEKMYNRFSFVVCYGRRKDTYLNQKIPVSVPHEEISSFYPSKKREFLVIQNVISPILKYRPCIVVTMFHFGIISNWLLLLLRPIFKYRLVLWGHGYNRIKGFSPQNSFFDRLRVWWMNKVDAGIPFNQEEKKKLSMFISKEKIFVAPNTLDTSKLLKIRDRLEKEGKEFVKQRLGFKQKYNLIFIGRLLEGYKQPDKLLQVYKEIRKEVSAIALHYVGDGPMLGILMDDIKRENIENVFFHGSIHDDEKTGELLFASDLMVMPGLLGLSINHAFCFDTPVVSQKIEGHGPEVEYVIDGKTGYLVENGDFTQMAKVIVKYLKDKNIQNDFRCYIRYMVENVCNVDVMIDSFQAAMKYVLSLKN